MTRESLDNIAGNDGVRNKHVYLRKYSDDEMRWLASTTFLAEHHDGFSERVQESVFDSKAQVDKYY